MIYSKPDKTTRWYVSIMVA